MENVSQWMFTVVNFICIMVLYGVVIYVFGKYMEVTDAIIELQNYRSINEAQLKNLVKDINYNDNYLARAITVAE